MGIEPFSWMIQDRCRQNWCFQTTFLEKMFCFINLTPQTPPSAIHGWKATDLLYKIVKTKKIFFWSCEASDFWGRSQTDFLHDLRLRLIFHFIYSGLGRWHSLCRCLPGSPRHACGWCNKGGLAFIFKLFLLAISFYTLTDKYRTSQSQS